MCMMTGSYDPSLRCWDRRIISSRQPGLHGKALSQNLNNKVWKLKVDILLLPVSRPYLAPASFPTMALFLSRICCFNAQVTCDRTSVSLLSWPFIFLCATIISWACPFLSGTVKCTRLILCSKSSPRVNACNQAPHFLCVELLQTPNSRVTELSAAGTIARRQSSETTRKRVSAWTFMHPHTTVH